MWDIKDLRSVEILEDRMPKDLRIQWKPEARGGI